MDLESEFRKAVENKRHRKKFVKMLMDRGVPEYIGNIKYKDSIFSRYDDSDAMRSDPQNQLAIRFGIKGTKSDIEVYPFAFDQEFHNNIDDFLSTLEDHEYLHAKQCYESPKKMCPPFWKLFFMGLQPGLKERLEKYATNAEISALENQVANFDYRNCSDRFMDECLADLEEYRVKLDEK